MECKRNSFSGAFRGAGDGWAAFWRKIIVPNAIVNSIFEHDAIVHSIIVQNAIMHTINLHDAIVHSHYCTHKYFVYSQEPTV